MELILIGTNIHIWNAISEGLTQTFSFSKTANSTYIINTRCSYYTKVVSLSNNICDNGVNIHQWEYSNHSHDQWILEPVDQDPNMGVNYAEANYNYYMDAYPHFGVDCTNFLSQCLLASGLHQHDDWFINRLNTEHSHIPTNSEEDIENLNNSWELSDPSPWISAKVFQSTFSDRKVATYTGANIVNDHQEVWNLNIFNGDVIQIAEPVLGIFIGNAEHSMYITGTDERYINNILSPTYAVTYHTENVKDRCLIDIAASSAYLDHYFIFYDFTHF